jgi:hypothetical protein
LFNGKTGWVFGGYMLRNDPKKTKNKPAAQSLVNTWVPCVMVGAWYTFNANGTYSVYLDGTDAPGWKGEYVFSAGDKTLTVKKDDKNDSFYNVKFINPEVMYLESKENGNITKYTARTTPLHTAVIYNKTADVKKILSGNYDVNQYADDYLGCGPALLYAFDYAGRKPSFEIITMLLDKGADPDIVYYPNLKTALHSAVGGSDDTNTAVIELLLKHKADVNAKTREGETALHFCTYAAGQRDNTNIIKLLLDNGANPAIKNGKGKTPADLAKDLLKEAGRNKLYTERMQKVIDMLAK